MNGFKKDPKHIFTRGGIGGSSSTGGSKSGQTSFDPRDKGELETNQKAPDKGGEGGSTPTGGAKANRMSFDPLKKDEDETEDLPGIQ